MNPSIVAEQGTSDGGELFSAFRNKRRVDTRRWLYVALVPVIPLVALVATLISMRGQQDAMRIVTAHGIRVVNPGMSRQEVVGVVGNPIGQETRADGAECFLHGMFSMNEPQTTVYVLCYLSGTLHDMTTRRYSLWSADPNGEFAPAGVPFGDPPAKSAPAAKP
jgi:hypothetical protein